MRSIKPKKITPPPIVQQPRIDTTSQSFTSEPKSKIAAGLLAIFLGGLGIHNFYLGYISRGVFQLLLSTIGSLVIIGPIIAGLWGFVEGIQILTGSIDKDGQGQPLAD
jgi:TM2 domain-containing membrane protein YozV